VSATTAFKSIPAQADDCHCAEIGVIGIGNPLMGDDGAGIAVVEKLRKLRPEGTGLFYYLLQRDLFEVADILDRARRFIFVDVFLGTPAGTIATIRDQSAALTPSIHQTDIGTAMRMLKKPRACRSVSRVGNQGNCRGTAVPARCRAFGAGFPGGGGGCKGDRGNG
jgi:hydrogenase maturation protease